MKFCIVYKYNRIVKIIFKIWILNLLHKRYESICSFFNILFYVMFFIKNICKAGRCFKYKRNQKAINQQFIFTFEYFIFNALVTENNELKEIYTALIPMYFIFWIKRLNFVSYWKIKNKFFSYLYRSVQLKNSLHYRI